MSAATPRRVLALHVTTRGFAFCLFNGPDDLYDWGIKHVGRGNKNAQSLLSIEQLIVRYDPHAIAFEDVSAIGSKRVARVRHLHRDIERLCDRASIDPYAYPWELVFSAIGRGQAKTRHDLSLLVANMIPTLARRLPPKRKIWLPQDPRQALFDAASLGLTFYEVSDG